MNVTRPLPVSAAALFSCFLFFPSLSQAAPTISRDCSLEAVRCVTNTAGPIADGTAKEYATIQACANVVNPGDVCRVAAGTYNEAVTVRRDGSFNDPITFVADGNVTITREFYFEFSDYIRLIGFTFDGLHTVQRLVNLHGTVGVELWNNTLRGYENTGIATTWQQNENPHTTSTRSLIIGNKFYGAYGHDYGHISLWGDDIVVAYNEMNRAGVDFLLFYGNRNRFINNYGWGSAENTALHIDFLQTGANCCGRVGGTDYMLLEGNFYIGAQGSDVHTWNLETAVDYSGNFLSRRNVMHRAGGGGAYDYHHFYIVNDLYAEMQLSAPTANICVYLARGSNQRIYNSIFADCWGSSVTAPFIVDVSTPGFAHDYNAAWDFQTGPSMDWRGPINSEANKIFANPLFVNYGSDDFHLQAGSPAVGTAGPVTTVTVGGTNVSSITVGDAGFFRGFNPSLNQYGGSLAIGDLITVTSQSVGAQTRRINSIAGNVITLMSPLTAEAGNPVFIGDDATPDRGPYPYKASYAVTNTLSINSGVLTATVNDPSLVRHVEFYIDDLPVAVDYEAPFTCNTSSFTQGTAHAFKAVARPFYASQTLGYTDEDLPPPVAPSNLKVVGSQ